MYDTMKSKRFGPDEVVEKFGVAADKVIDVQALAGDSVDNVPGVPGIGIKTAAQLINEYGNLEKLLEGAPAIKQKKRRENLIEFAEQARISMRLVKLATDVEDLPPLGELEVIERDSRELVAFLKEMQFTTLTRRVATILDVDASEISPSSRLNLSEIMPESHTQNTEEAKQNESGDALTPQKKALKIHEELSLIALDHSKYETVRDLDALARWVNLITQKGYVAFDSETTSLDAMEADIVGFSLSVTPGEACYIPVGHQNGDGLLCERTPDQLTLEQVFTLLKPVLEDKSITIIGQNLKYDWLVLANHGVHINAMDDTMLMSYALDAGLGGHGMDALAERHLDLKPISYSDVAGKGKAQINFSQVDIDSATKYAAEDADITLRLWHLFNIRIVAEQRAQLYHKLEKPMIETLAQMEQRGIAIAPSVLNQLSSEFAQTMARLEEEIHSFVGHPFNIGSPKQLGEVLFGELGLPGGKKTKTGAWSTGAAVLEDLAAEGHELPRKIVDWRQVSKLKSTYTDALPSYINARTNRVHTSFSLAATTTGRLSSSDPNVQNIPIRTAEGRKIRTAFVAEKGMKLISADYSQIELRVLAHVGDVPQLKQAFADGHDIHAMTASEMFGMPIEGMDPMVRRRAKAINFGIIYGISAFGLANQLSISRSEAKDYIDTYFKRFPGIKDYMEETKQLCKENGYVETIFGRRAHYPNINSKNPSERAFNERAAINAPIQGAAADIIRRAMVRMDDRLEKAGLQAQMLLQVHDELIFEVPEAEVEKTLPVIISTMEKAAEPAISLTVPLKVEAQAADNWDEAH